MTNELRALLQEIILDGLDGDQIGELAGLPRPEIGRVVAAICENEIERWWSARMAVQG